MKQILLVGKMCNLCLINSKCQTSTQQKTLYTTLLQKEEDHQH